MVSPGDVVFSYASGIRHRARCIISQQIGHNLANPKQEMSKLPLTQENAAAEIGSALAAFGCQLRVAAEDVSVTENVVMLGFRRERLADEIFDFVFPKAISGIYYHYTSFETFQVIVASGMLRLFSTKKRSSVGEFLPFCSDYGLDGYWRRGTDGKEEGEHLQLMDDLFYKSFVASPTEAAEELWDQFADKHQGTRLAFEITVHPDYRNFRHVAYQDSDRVPLIKALQSAFARYDRKFVTRNLSRMGCFYQLTKHSYQNECRLLVKHFPENPEFPFKILEDKEQECKYIDCDLTKPTCSAFQIRLVEVVAGRNRPIEEVRNYVKKHSRITGLNVAKSMT
jgi:hypothetical protein